MDNISDLLSSVSPEELERLKSVAQNLIGNANSGGASAQKSSPAPEKSDAGSNLSSLFGDDLTKALTAVAGQMRHEDDRTKFIQALRPLLSEDRRQKADEALRFLRLMDALPLLKGLF